MTSSLDWWRTAVTYQLYVRSFADGDGNGIGDLAGIRSRLGYLADLGVDALWINPWYASPQADGGYDVSDYRQIDPLFGTVPQAQELIREAQALGLKVLLDVVPNHTSDDHVWFQAALAASPGSPERDRYMFRDGTGPDGSQPPNDWLSVFGGLAWTRITEPDGTPGQWYLHLFDTRQPDLNWRNDEVRAELLEVLKFWFALGADGFRIDVAHGMIKQEGLPNLGERTEQALLAVDVNDHPFWNRPEIHSIFETWRELAETYSPPKVFVAEAWVGSPEALVDFVRPGRLHTSFDFDLLRAAWNPAELRETITASTTALATVNAPVMWVLSNHDIVRHVTRLGRDQVNRTKDPLHDVGGGIPVDLALGTRRARAAIMLELGLPGGVYLYQGEELGLPEVEDLPEDVLADPTWERSGRTVRGRDGCRVPLPWEPSGPSLGFGPGESWLPQPASFAALAASTQAQDPASMLRLYRAALAARRAAPELSAPDGPGLTWLDLGEDVLAFTRGQVAVVVNFGATPLTPPAGELLLCSDVAIGQGQALPADTAAWIRLA